jgi:L,D-transpeptidase catalytic domain
MSVEPRLEQLRARGAARAAARLRALALLATCAALWPSAAVAIPAAGATAGAAAGATAGAAAGATAGAAAGATAGAAPGAVASLSNLTTLSRWAYPQAEVTAREHPSMLSRAVGRLHFLTSDGEAELYVALRSYTTEQQAWTLVPLPGRPNGATGWVPAGALGELHVTREHLRINREALRATLYRDGRAIWRAPVGIGRPSLPTPPGHFYVTARLGAIGGPFYGPHALATSAYAPTLSDWPGGGVIGIHGTDEPQLIPGRPSHGCIRVRNPEMTRLWALIEIGTPIEIV